MVCLQDTLAESTPRKGSEDDWDVYLPRWEDILFQTAPSEGDRKAGELHMALQPLSPRFAPLICMGFCCLSNALCLSCAAIDGLQVIYKQLLEALPSPSPGRRLNQAQQADQVRHIAPQE